MLRVAPLSLRQANDLVEKLHRHHKPVTGHRFSIAALDGDKLVGAIIVGRPVARGCDPYNVAEVTRLVTDGTKNACSLLYSAAARAAKAMGFTEIQTYILASESGISLKASGWTRANEVRGRSWNTPGGHQGRDESLITPKVRWIKHLNPILPSF